jgi:hypothetical protein
MKKSERALAVGLDIADDGNNSLPRIQRRYHPANPPLAGILKLIAHAASILLPTRHPKIQQRKASHEPSDD